MLPDLPGFAAHHVERARFGGERETLPFVAVGAAKPKLAGSPQRQPEDLVEVRLVAVPSNAHADIVLGTQNLPDGSGRQIAEIFNRTDDRYQLCGDWLGLLKSLRGVIVAEAERSNPPFSFVGAELEWL